MIHQVPPDHVAAVGDAIGGPPAVFRHQQQPWRFDTVCRDDVDFRLHASAGFRSGVADEIDLAYASVLTDDDIAAKQFDALIRTEIEKTATSEQKTEVLSTSSAHDAKIEAAAAVSTGIPR